MSFFDLYRSSGFKPRPDLGLAEEFNRLALHCEWTDKDEKCRFRCEALKAEFAHHFGSDNSKLENWKRVCEFLGEEVGSSITQCKATLRKVNVNICHLIDEARTGKETRKFKTYHALRKYTVKKRLYYPLKHTKQGGVDSYLKILLKTFH